MTRQIHIWPKPVEKRDESLIISASIGGARGDRKTFWFQMDETYESWLTESADPWVLTAIFNAMRSRADLVVHGSVSRSLLVNLKHFQQIWSRWRPNQYRSVDITAEEELHDQPRQGEAIAGFTAGVDSCFTAYRHRRGLHVGRELNLTAGLTVIGFDVPLSDRRQFPAVLAKCGRLLQTIGMESLSMVTNIREQPVTWVDLHGTALAASLTVLAGRFVTGVIASTIPIGKLDHPYGSHLLTDPLMGSDAFPIIHDGAECGREEKVRLLAEWPQSMTDLRVCWEGKQRDRNCGQCSKCIRTKFCFMVNGLSVPPALGRPPTESEIRSWRLTDEWELANIGVLIERARQNGQDQQPWLETLSSLDGNLGGLRRRLRMNRVRRFLSVKAPQRISAYLHGSRGGKVGLPLLKEKLSQTSEGKGGSF